MSNTGQYFGFTSVAKGAKPCYMFQNLAHKLCRFFCMLFSLLICSLQNKTLYPH